MQNAVRKHKGVFLTNEVLGTSGANLTNCGRNNFEVSSFSWLPIENIKISKDLKEDRTNKSRFKIWNKFVQSLRLKNVTVLKDFKALSQWKWQHDENEDKLCIKMNDKEHDEHVHNKSNVRWKVHVCECNKEKLSKKYYGTIGTFTNGELRIIDNDEDF